MATGDFWDVSNPLKPTGIFDPDDEIHLPYDFGTWLTSQNTTYASHTITPDSGLDYEEIGVQGGLIVINIFASGSPALVAGHKYGVTCQITAADGQKRSQTLYLKVKQL